MANQELIADLRAALKTLVVQGQPLSDATIDYFVNREIKEIEIAGAIPANLQRDQTYISAFVAALHARLAARGAGYDQVAHTYDLSVYALTGPVARTAGEDLSAIKKYGDAGRCDLVKAITNVLRNIKAAGL